MAEQRERLEEALQGCAERGVPEGVDLWPSISGRVEARATGVTRRAPRRARLVPGTRAGWAVALLAVLLLSTGAYAARGVLYATFRGELPGAQGPVYGEQIDQAKAAGGARVTLGWAYADEKFVVVGFDVEDLAGERRVAGQPADLQSVLVSEEPGYEERIEKEFPERVDLTDEGNTGFRMVGGQQQGSEGPGNMMEGPNSNSAVFQAQGTSSRATSTASAWRSRSKRWRSPPRRGKGGRTPSRSASPSSSSSRCPCAPPPSSR